LLAWLLVAAFSFCCLLASPDLSDRAMSQVNGYAEDAAKTAVNSNAAAGDDVEDSYSGEYASSVSSSAAGSSDDEGEEEVKAEEEKAGAGASKLPNPKSTRRKAIKLCNRAQDGKLIRATYRIPERFRSKKGFPQADVDLVFMDILTLVVEKLMDPTISKKDTTHWEAEVYKGLYGELPTGNWWRDAERRSRVREVGAYLLALLLYTDGSTADFRAGFSLYPIVFTVGNFIGDIMRSSKGNITVGYWPKLKFDAGVDATLAAECSRDLQQWCVRQLMNNIETYRNGLLVRLPWEDEKTGMKAVKVLVPVLAAVLTDWPEGQMMSGTKQGASCAHANCRVCAMALALYGCTEEGACAQRRVEAETREFAEEFKRDEEGAVIAKGKTLKEMRAAEVDRGCFAEQNGFWTAELFSNKYGVHALCPNDTLHTLSAGIVPALKKILLKHHQHTGTGKAELDKRFRALPRVHDAARRGLFYRSFDNILTQATWTADDYIALLQQMFFVVGVDDAIIGDEAAREAFVGACEATLMIIVALKMRVISEGQLNDLHACAKALGPLLTAAVGGLPNFVVVKLMTINRPKVHALLHLRYFIRRYGAGVNFDTGTYETNHKLVVHQLYARDCNRAAGRLLRLTASLNARQVMRMLQDRLAAVAPPEVVPTLSFTCPLNINVGQAFSALANERRGPPLLHLLILLKGGMETPLPNESWPVYGAMRAAYGSETVVYACSQNYRRGGVRRDTVTVQWEDEPESVVRLECLFGRCKSKPITAANGQLGNGGMFALVRCFPDSAGLSKATSVSTGAGKKMRVRNFALPFPLVEELDTRSTSNYYVIDVSAINGHAHLQPVFDGTKKVEGKWWWDRIPLRA